MKLVGSLTKDKMVKVTIEMVEMFVKNLETLLAIFDNSYQGSDYCKGIIFGMSGADLLINISQKAVELSKR